MLLVEETAPAQASLPVAALRGHLRMGSGFELVEDAAEDAALAGFLRAAIATVEARRPDGTVRRFAFGDVTAGTTGTTTGQENTDD